MKELHRLRTKIILPVVIYLIVIGIGSNSFLYAYLLQTVSTKAEHLDRIYLEGVQVRLDRDFAELFSLAALCANDPLVVWTISRGDRNSQERLRDSIKVQDKLSAYLQASPVSSYVNKLILWDEKDLFVQIQGRGIGEPNDYARLQGLPLYTQYKRGTGWRTGFGPPVTALTQRPDAYSIFFPVQGYNNTPEGFIYLEAGLDMIIAVFKEYGMMPGLSAITENGNVISPAGLLEPSEPLWISHTDGLRFRRNRRNFRLDMQPLENAALFLRNEVDITELRRDDRDIFYTVLVAILSSLLAAAGLALTLSYTLTKPIQHLVSRIKKIGDNDFSYDPVIERSPDEIGQIGRAVNEMSGSIAKLLEEMEARFRQQKRTEIALLQTRINPHFLYNTLDSIQWMAKIQKNTGIADLTRSLINLLRNIAGGSGDFITLGEELCLLEDYAAVMSIRFMGIFELVNRIDPALYYYQIPKLTLQPLVENAILHGIEPSGGFGSIVLEARLAEPYLIITVEDSGMGMSAEKLQSILTQKAGNTGTSLNTIGVMNVHERLRLVYGESCGLSFESEEGLFTRVTVRIYLKEEKKPCSECC